MKCEELILREAHILIRTNTDRLLSVKFPKGSTNFLHKTNDSEYEISSDLLRILKFLSRTQIPGGIQKTKIKII